MGGLVPPIELPPIEIPPIEIPEIEPLYDCKEDTTEEPMFQIAKQPENETFLDAAVWSAIVGGWVYVGVRWFMAYILFRFVKEAEWLKSNNG